MRLIKIELADLWSYSGPKRTVLSELAQVNVVIGRNNVGKSNLMRAIRWVKEESVFEASLENPYQPSSSAIFNPGNDSRDIAPFLRVTFSLDHNDWITMKNDPMLSKLARLDPRCLSCLVELGFESVDLSGQLIVNAVLSAPEMFVKSCDETGTSQADAKDAVKVLGLSYIRERLVVLDGWRRLSDPVAGASSFFDFLHGLQASMRDLQTDFVCLQKVQQFFSELTGLDEVQIHVRDDKCGFNIAVEGRYLPLSSYGDGISHLFMIAAKAAVYDHSVILIEEPETHLHPDLQRHLLRFLTEKLSAQVILTTHSPVLLDSSLVDKVIRVDHLRGSSFLTSVETSKGVYSVLDELGARASDILQANVVIWVEGPSDRIFLKRCLSFVAKSFREGLHFQIVCYGGALRSHLTFDEDLEPFVNLMRLSRNVIMVCDSDRANEGEGLNETKERLRDECVSVGGFYWITEGREIENYLSDDVLSRSYKQLLNRNDVSINLGQYDKLGAAIKTAVGRVKRGDNWKVDYDGHKATLMKCFMDNVHSLSELNRYDLKARLEEVSKIIARANQYRSTDVDV